jgi:D-alanine-D-alanine ligase
LRVGIFAGGQSAEHEVSVASAAAILAAIDRDRFAPFLVYIDHDGGWHLPAAESGQLESGALAAAVGAGTISDASARLRAGTAAASLTPVGDPSSAVAARAAVRSLAETIDVAFLAIHGPFGEDGTLQGFLELAGIPYTGAGVAASALAMDKVLFKDVMRGHGLPVVDYASFARPGWEANPTEVVDRVLTRFPGRSVVKPARLGSSIGMTLVHGADEMPAALAEAFAWDAKVIVEDYVANARELECGILGNDELIVFEPGEVRSHREFYDYEAKYLPGLADVLPRADVSVEMAAHLRDLAARAYRAVDAAGMARVDFLVREDEAWISEMNTIPGFTATSMFPKQAELAGIGFADLVSRLIDLGLAADRRGKRGAR